MTLYAYGLLDGDLVLARERGSPFSRWRLAVAAAQRAGGPFEPYKITIWISRIATYRNGDLPSTDAFTGRTDKSVGHAFSPARAGAGWRPKRLASA